MSILVEKQTMSDVHTVCLQLFEAFAVVCMQHNLQWFADSGTLLGAVRDGKLIPWDDDMDFIMPRVSYNRLLEIGKYAFKAPVFFQTSYVDDFFCGHIRLCMNGTARLTKADYNQPYHRGIAIDIFPYDSLPNNEDEASTLQGFLRQIQKYACPVVQSLQYCGTLNAYDAASMMDKMLTQVSCKYMKSEYVINSPFYYSNKYKTAKLLRSDYSSYTEMKIDGSDIPLRIPVGYIDILTTWYGKTWQTPIQEDAGHENKSGHAFIDCKNSYLKYDKLTPEEFEKLFNVIQ